MIKELNIDIDYCVIISKKGANVMKYLNKTMVFFLFMLVSFGADISAYNYPVTNFTGQPIKVRLHYAFGKLNKQDDLIEFMGTNPFSFTGGKIGLCLTSIEVSWFDAELDRWVDAMTAPMQSMTSEAFEATKNAITAFDEQVVKVGKLAALAGETGVIVSQAIEGLVGVVEGAVKLWEISLCRNRDFIIILAPFKLPDGSELLVGGKPVLVPYALTPP